MCLRIITAPHFHGWNLSLVRESKQVEKGFSAEIIFDRE